jgi:hypothetical protein
LLIFCVSEKNKTFANGAVYGAKVKKILPMKQNRIKQGLSIILEALLLWNGIGSLVTIRIRDKKKRSRRGRRSSRNRYYTRSVLLAAWNGQKQAPTLLLQTRNGR